MQPATLLALYPLYRENWIEGPVFADAKTGSSGSGRNPSAKTHHPRRSQSFFPYKPFEHQHIPEMLQLLDRPENPFVFQPYSAPFVRGIFASHYMETKVGLSLRDVEELFQGILWTSTICSVVREITRPELDSTFQFRRHWSGL